MWGDLPWIFLLTFFSANVPKMVMVMGDVQISASLASAICGQMESIYDTGIIQPVLKHPPKSSNGLIGTYSWKRCQPPPCSKFELLTSRDQDNDSRCAHSCLVGSYQNYQKQCCPPQPNNGCWANFPSSDPNNCQKATFGCGVCKGQYTCSSCGGDTCNKFICTLP